ncbi:MAG: glutamine amidotransferase [Nitrospirota bacterium]
MKKALAIRHVHFEDCGTLGDVLRERGFEIAYVEAGLQDLKGIDPGVPDLLIGLGGPISVYEADIYPFINDELDLFKRRIAARKPVMGICLGAQMLAYALGGKVYPGKQKEIGWKPLELTKEGENSPVAHLAPGNTSMLHWHGDTFDLPPDAVLLASTDVTRNQIYSYGDFLLAFQCHPELVGAKIESWLIGHASEIATSKVATVEAIRHDTERYGDALETAGRKCFEEWLTNLSL